MDLVKPMLRAIFLLALVSLSGCSSKKDAGMPERYLYFTGTFPADFKWEVLTNFKATSGGRWACSTLTWQRGQPEATIHTEFYPVEKSGDTVRVPLFYAKSPQCGWKLNNIRFQDESKRCIVVRSLSLMDEGTEMDSTDRNMPAPRTLELDCAKVPDTECIDCNPRKGEGNGTYAIPKDSLIHFAIKLNFLGAE